MTSAILAVDLGKFNSVFCWYDPDTRGATFRTARTTPDDLRQEFTRRPVARVVFEACSQAGWVHDLCEQLGGPGHRPVRVARGQPAASPTRRRPGRR
jgi:transposase